MSQETRVQGQQPQAAQPQEPQRIAPQPTAHPQVPVIWARGLSKWYGQVIGLNYFNLDIWPGITGIVGPNGAGKSTFFKLITGLIRPNVGEVNVMGQKPWHNLEMLSNIGFCPDYDNLNDDVSGTECLSLTGSLHGMKGRQLDDRIEKVARIVGMSHAMDRKIGGYSKGMRQRIKIAASIIHEPRMLLLDEPLSGTDPMARKELIDLIKSLHRDHGHDIIVSSHVLFEVERLTRNVALIYKGRAVASGHISEIRALIDRHPHNIVVEGSCLGELAKSLLDKDYTVTVGLSPDRSSMTVQVTRPDEFFGDVACLAAEVDCEIRRLYSLDDNLEAVFRYLVGW